jgi:putative flippase GtrA
MDSKQTAASDDSRSRFLKQLLRFLVVGGSSVAVDLICYAVLLNHMDRIAAKGLSYLAGVLFGFAGNKFWTFESQRRSYSEPAIYFLLYLSTMVLNIAINSWVFHNLQNWNRAEDASQLLAFLVATGVTTVINFLGLKHLAFRQNPNP